MAGQSTAGQRVRDDMARALEHAAAEVGRPLQYDERETRAIEAAASAADRAEQLRTLWDAELAAGDGARASVAVKIAAEIRLLERHIADLLARANPAPGQAKSERHVRAANRRWDIDPTRRRRGSA